MNGGFSALQDPCEAMPTNKGEPFLNTHRGEPHAPESHGPFMAEELVRFKQDMKVIGKHQL
jgi:hypothetical protein